MDTSKHPSSSPSSKKPSFLDSLEGVLGLKNRRKYAPLTPIEILPGIMSNDPVATVFQLDNRKPRNEKQTAARRATSLSTNHIRPGGGGGGGGGASQKTGKRMSYFDVLEPVPPPPVQKTSGSSGSRSSTKKKVSHGELANISNHKRQERKRSRKEQDAEATDDRPGDREPISPTDRLIVRHANPFTGLLSRNQTEVNITRYGNAKSRFDMVGDLQSPPYPHSKTPSASTPNLGGFDELVPMPSVHEPAPFTFPGASAEEIEAYERAIRATTEQIARNLNVDLSRRSSRAETIRSKSQDNGKSNKRETFLSMGGLDQEGEPLQHQDLTDILLDRHDHHHPHTPHSRMLQGPYTLSGPNRAPSLYLDIEHSPQGLPPQLSPNPPVPTTPLTRPALRKHQRQQERLAGRFLRAPSPPPHTSISISTPLEQELPIGKDADDTHIYPVTVNLPLHHQIPNDRPATASPRTKDQRHQHRRRRRGRSSEGIPTVTKTPIQSPVPVRPGQSRFINGVTAEGGRYHAAAAVTIPPPIQAFSRTPPLEYELQLERIMLSDLKRKSLGLPHLRLSANEEGRGRTTVARRSKNEVDQIVKKALSQASTTVFPGRVAMEVGLHMAKSHSQNQKSEKRVVYLQSRFLSALEGWRVRRGGGRDVRGGRREERPAPYTTTRGVTTAGTTARCRTRDKGESQKKSASSSTISVNEKMPGNYVTDGEAESDTDELSGMMLNVLGMYYTMVGLVMLGGLWSVGGVVMVPVVRLVE